VPWQYVMALDMQGLVAMLLSARSDEPSRVPVLAASPSDQPGTAGGCSAGADVAAAGGDAGAMNALVGPESSLGVLSSAQDAASIRENAQVLRRDKRPRAQFIIHSRS
jgi:hypothetical protein